jgi:hypothetical protein
LNTYFRNIFALTITAAGKEEIWQALLPVPPKEYLEITASE